MSSLEAFLDPRSAGRRVVAKSVAVSFVVLAGILRVMADDAPTVECKPNWNEVTWETRYDQAKLARIRLNPKSLLPGQLAVTEEQEVTFAPPKGQEVTLGGGWSSGGYVFDSWEELLKLLEEAVGGISIKQTAFTQNSNHQIFALSPDQQKALSSQKGVLSLKVKFELYQLRLRAKFALDAPVPVQDGGVLYQVVDTAGKTGVKGSPAADRPTEEEPNGKVMYLNGKRVSQAEAIATLVGNRTRLDISRKGAIDPADQRPGRALVYLLVNPDDHTGTILQGVAPNGFFDPRRDPSRLDVVDHLGIVADKTPLTRKILYVFDPLVGDTTEVTLKNPDFMMQWPQDSTPHP